MHARVAQRAHERCARRLGQHNLPELKQWEIHLSSTPCHLTGQSDANPSNLSLTHLNPTSPELASFPLSSPSDSQSSLTSTTYQGARDMAEYLSLREYGVEWKYGPAVVMQMDASPDTKALLPNELKLVVEQRVAPGDPELPRVVQEYPFRQ
ncbi:hypothetical protein OE88DRAFT_1656356 [Heliocybe sulcata]|uniref:Uncharacterized protein n=1 Tax=Heliocybe sulcata TaxID=5364 RepID=A0A5C3N7K1_9AGAM|nr:hypothetical protein OE88DRAFT_1656356 [Heliocybe sulcata]